MLQGVINEPVSEHFTVSDSDGNLIAGILAGAFTLYVYNPTGNEVSGSVSGTITELGSGNYKYIFTPDLEGTWFVTATHGTYFPWGKSNDIQVFNADLSTIYNIVAKTLGLSHHNMYIDNTIFADNGNMTSARVRTYSNKGSVGTGNDVIETYLIEADESECGQFNYYKQVVA